MKMIMLIIGFLSISSTSFAGPIAENFMCGNPTYKYPYSPIIDYSKYLYLLELRYEGLKTRVYLTKLEKNAEEPLKAAIKVEEVTEAAQSEAATVYFDKSGRVQVIKNALGIHLNEWSRGAGNPNPYSADCNQIGFIR